MSSCEAPTAVLEGPDGELVRRDPALPMLPLLLDDTVLSAWLSARLGEAVLARRQYLRYKHGTACVAAVRLRPASSELALPGQGNEPRPEDRTVMVAHWTEGARSKLTKTCDKAAPGSLLLVDESLGVVVSTPGADRDLPAMSVLEDPRRRRRTLRRLADGRLRGDATQCLTLSYKPQRRWVASATGSRAGRALLRAYRPEDLHERLAASRALAPTGLVPELLGSDDELGLAAFAWVEGRQLRLPDDVAHVAALGEGVARLHDVATELPRRGVAERARGLYDTAALAATLLPDLGPRLHAAVSRAERALLAYDGTAAVTLHGDLSSDQVVIAPQGGTRLIDLDRARTGHPADDLGSLLATAPGAGAAGDAGADAGVDPTSLLEELLDGYARHRPVPASAEIDAFAGVHLLERATDGFRLACPGWARHLTEAVAGAEDRLGRSERAAGR